MPQGTTIPRAAVRLSVPESTVREWVKSLSVGTMDGAKLVLSDRDLDLLDKYRVLRDQGHGKDTITRQLRPLEAEPVEDAPQEHGDPAADTRQALESLAAEVWQTRQGLTEVARLAQQFSAAERASGEMIGELRAKVEHQADKIQDRDRTIADLTAQLVQARHEAKQLETKSDPVAKLSWWERWL